MEYDVLSGDTIKIIFRTKVYGEETSLELTNPKFNIYHGLNKVGTEITPTRASIGVYEHLYTIPTSYVNKQLIVECSGTYGSKHYLETKILNVIRTRE